MFQPRSYQRLCLATLARVRRTQSRALIVIAAGLGKTVIAAMDAGRWLREHPEERVLYLCHQNDILEQAKTMFEAEIGGDASRYGYYHGHAKEAHVQFLFASFQMMRKHLSRFRTDEFGYIVVDESHHAPAETYRLVVGYFRPKFLLGVTATPDRFDLQDIRQIFGEEVFSLDLPEALARGLLTPVDYRLVTDEIVRLGEIRNPFRLTVQELNRLIFVPKRDEEIAGIIRERTAHVKNLRMMIFCRTIEHAERFQAYVSGSITIHSDLSRKEQAERLEGFRDGTVNTIITVDKFNEGIDVPEVNVVVFLRSTQSSTVFYQQLGRGLRKMEGKDNVLALDFVGNCDRVAVVYALLEEVRRTQEHIIQSRRRSMSARKGVVVNFGGFDFDETARNVLEILGKVRRGYDRETLIAQLQAEAKWLRRTPIQRDMDVACSEGRTVSAPTFYHVFGSWNAALKAAGFSPNRGRYTKEELIAQLQSEHRRLGRIPTISDIKLSSKARRTANERTFRHTFGSWNNALTVTGLLVNRRRHTKKGLIAELAKEATRLGRAPSKRDIQKASRARRTAGSGTYRKYFGSWSELLRVAGLSARKGRYTEEQLVVQLKAEFERLRRTPSRRDIVAACKAGRTATSSTFSAHFGSFRAAIIAAGLSSDFRRRTKEELIAELKSEAALLNRTPTCEDMRKAAQVGRMASLGTYRRRFGSLATARRAAGLGRPRSRERK